MFAWLRELIDAVVDLLGLAEDLDDEACLLDGAETATPEEYAELDAEDRDDSEVNEP